MAKRCRICGRRFSTDIALKQHIRTQHRGYYYGVRIGPAIVLLAVVAIALYALAAPSPEVTPVTPLISSQSEPQTPGTGIQSASASKTTAEASAAPDFKLPEVDELGFTGRVIRLSQFEGKPVFLEFISPLCGHCRKMTPVIKDLEEKYGDRIVFISVVWTGGGGVELVSQFLKQYKLDWVHVVDERLEVFRAYGVRGTPTYMILDKDHVVKRKFVGSATTEKQLEAAILEVIEG